MSDSRYKTLLANLPAVAAVVNSFESEAVQRAAFDQLMSALDKHTVSKSANRANGNGHADSRNGTSAEGSGEYEVVHELVDGGNIHSDLDD